MVVIVGASSGGQTFVSYPVSRRAACSHEGHPRGEPVCEPTINAPVPPAPIQCPLPGAPRCADACHARGADKGRPEETRADPAVRDGVGTRPFGGWTMDPSLPAAVHLVHVLVEPALVQYVQTAAGHQKVRAAVCWRQALRLVNPEDFPPGWRAGESTGRSHDSGHDQRRVMLRLDDTTSGK
jgi:hypothetical protein